jgi:hypothetical protein
MQPVPPSSVVFMIPGRCCLGRESDATLVASLQSAFQAHKLHVLRIAGRLSPRLLSANGASWKFDGAQIVQSNSVLRIWKGSYQRPGIFIILTIAAGPLLVLAGMAIIISGFKLMAGYIWDGTVLRISSWIALGVSIAWLL